MNAYRWKFALIAIVVALLLWAYAAFGLTLGIDLQGGTVLVYKVDVTGIRNPNVSALTKSTIEILHKRLDTLGMKEMAIRQAGDDQIMIQLPGVSEQTKERIKDIIRKAGQLWFKIVVDPSSPSFDPQLIRDIEDRKARGEYVMDEDEFDTARDGRTGGRTLLLMNTDAVPGKLLEGADPTSDQWGGPAVRFYMKREGTSQLALTTTRYVEKQMAIVLDGVAMSAPKIRNPITEGTGVIEGQFTRAEVDDLITVLRSGALPAKPILASEDTVEPTLGQESIQRGMLAVYLSVGLVILFMLVYYRSAGMIANTALVVNVVLLLGILSLFEATLTLPGIAGIVLTIGMAVDANILIFERMREEKKRGVPFEEVVNAGYGHAFWAIFDGHVTTILSAAILFYVGTGPIRGFAVTLMIGIAVSLFTALFVTRTLYQLLMAKGWLKDITMIELRKEVSKIPFLQKRGPFVMASVIMLNLGYLSFVVRGDQKYGIDFNGGIALQIRAVKDLTKAEIEERLAKVERPGPSGPERPYVDVEVTRLGEAVNAAGAGRQFQILLSGTGATKAPEKKSASGLTPALAAETGAAPASAADEIPAPTAQDVFVHDIETVFAAELAPRAFSERKVEADPSGRGRMSISVNLIDDVSKAPPLDEIRDALAAKEIPEPVVTGTANVIHVRTGLVDMDVRALEAVEAKIKSVCEEKLAKLISNPFPFKTSIGASVAESLKGRAIVAIILSLLMIIGYLAFRFEVKWGVAAALCLFHDVLVALGFMMLLDVTSRWTGIDAKQNLTTIAAYLTIVGYSINDTIITFDRMRENLRGWDEKASGESYEAVLERSINETLLRTILTSFTVFIVLVVLALSGVKSLQSFTLALIVGVVFGTYSSIVVATPILLTPPRKLLMICAAELGFFIVAGVIGGFLRL